jgi:hypothetical protein
LRGLAGARTIARVQTHGTDLVELTVMMDREDHQRMNSIRELPGASIIVPISVLGAVVSAVYREWIGTAFLALLAAVMTIGGPLWMRRGVAAFPDFAFAPYTYRFTPESLTVENAVSRREIRWTALTRRVKTGETYVFEGPGLSAVKLARRTLTPEDEAALDALLARI